MYQQSPESGPLFRSLFPPFPTTIIPDSLLSLAASPCRSPRSLSRFLASCYPDGSPSLLSLPFSCWPLPLRHLFLIWYLLPAYLVIVSNNIVTINTTGRKRGKEGMTKGRREIGCTFFLIQFMKRKKRRKKEASIIPSMFVVDVCCVEGERKRARFLLSLSGMIISNQNQW